ncbi:MAG: phage portal protein [Trueperella sp.]|uniref:phage portal protein n=1 Tax=Trueperella sp. TaxID=2699835 RepID=UPI002A91BDFC|nr:phage portal protein [Trueperella sp.]MDY5404402.1 phage portal protein [Trueperella sp.]
MTPAAVVDLVNDELAGIGARQVELDQVDQWLTADNPMDTYRRAHTAPNTEKGRLGELSVTPILELIVAEVAQQMIVGRISVPGDDTAASRLRRPWDANGMPSKQYALWHAGLAYGQSHMLVLPDRALRPHGQRGVASLLPFSPRQLFVKWGDPLEDEYPLWAIRLIGDVNEWTGLRVYDEQAVHYLTRDTTTGGLTYVEYREHGMGVCPVVTFSNDLDLEARSRGEVEKFRGVAGRLEKTTLDRLMAQHYNSWKVRYATGMEEPLDSQDAAEQRQKLAHNDILVGGAGVQFGTLPETSLDGLLKAAEADRDTLAAVSQTPVWALNGGQLVNLSAEALLEARSMQRQKVAQKQRSNGVGVARVLRLAAHAEGREDDAGRFDITVGWEDTESRALSATADGLFKLGQLGIPPELLVEMIPGLSSERVADWKAHLGSGSEAGRLVDVLERQIYGQNAGRQGSYRATP